MKVEGEEVVQTVWYCEEIQNTNRDMYKLKGMPMEYDMDMQGMHVNYFVSNVSKEKWYAKIYGDFKTQYQISKDNYNALYGNIDFVQCLYDQQELWCLTKSFVWESKYFPEITRNN